MHDERQRVDGLARKQYVQLHQLRGLVVVEVVVERGVALRVRLKLIEIVHDKLRQRDLPQHLHRRGRQVVHGDEGAAARRGQLHDRAHVIGRDEDLRLEVGLLDALDLAGIGHLLGRVQRDHLAALAVHVVFHAWRRCQKVEAELALEALLDDLHVQQA